MWTMQMAVCYQLKIKWLSGKNCTVINLLQEKHTFIQKADLEYLITHLKNWDLPFQPSVFEKNWLSKTLAELKANDSHGPSVLDSGEWRRPLTPKKPSSINLCKTVPKFAIRIATKILSFLNSYKDCCLIALEKCPGFQIIGIC